MAECACGAGEGEFAEVFGDDDGVRREQREAFAAEEGECGLVFFCAVVGRVEEDDVGFVVRRGEATECG